MSDSPERKPVTIATCMPKQEYTREAKLEWLDRVLGETECDLFATSQEYFGGHYCWQLAKRAGKQFQIHVDKDWLVSQVGRLAIKHGKHVAVGACCTSAGGGSTEDYLYIDDHGELLGTHKKFALPAYDDMRAGGAGQLWPETDFRKRATLIDIPKLRLRVATQFCWEIYAQVLWPIYSLAGVNLVVSPVKFCPNGWLCNKKLDDGLIHIDHFGHAPKSTMWKRRLIAASEFQVFCPIAISCNSWDLGPKMMALVGHVDELRKTTTLLDVPSIGTEEKIHTFEIVPEYYTGLDHHHSAGAFKAHVGSVEGFSEMGEWVMSGKIRRLEAHLLGGTTKLDCILKAAAAGRQKKSLPARAFGKPQQVRMPKRRPMV